MPKRGATEVAPATPRARRARAGARATAEEAAAAATAGEQAEAEEHEVRALAARGTRASKRAAAADEEERAFSVSGLGARCRIATSGFTLSHKQYWARFDCLELNNTFYRTPKPDVWRGWADGRPRPSTAYVVKAHQWFTHRKRLRLDDAFRERWALWWGQHCSLLADAGCLLCLLWQLPPNFERSAENEARLRDALLSPASSPVAATAAAGAATPLRCAIEFRHASWHCAPVYALLRDADWCLVTTVQNTDARRWAGDLRSGVTPALQAAPSSAAQLPVLTCDWGAYVRFHGGAGQYLGRHGDAEMRGWAQRFASLLRRDSGRTLFAAFNNTDDATPPSAVEDALALGRELRQLGCMD